MAGLTVLRKWQAALESARGTDLACTRKFHATGGLEKLQPGHWPMLDVGGFDRRRDRYALLVEAGGQAEMPVSFEDLAWWLQLAVKGGVTGVQEGVTTAYRYTFVPTAAVDDLKSATLEWGDDFQAWQANFAMVDQLEIKGAPGEPLTMTAAIVAKNRDESTFTAALGDRQVEVVLGRRAALYIDEPGGTIGTTAVAGKLIGFEHKISNKLARFYTMDDADNGALSDITRDDRVYDTKLRYRFNSVSEYQKWAANTERLISVKFTGTDASGNGSFFRRAQFYLPGWYEDAVIGEQDGAVTIEMTLNSRYSAALGYAASYQVVNALAALP
jgi:hypothetical protein